MSRRKKGQRNAASDIEPDPIYTPPRKRAGNWSEPTSDAAEKYCRSLRDNASEHLNAVRRDVAELLRKHGVEIDGAGLPLFRGGEEESRRPVGKATRQATRAAREVARAADVLLHLAGLDGLEHLRAFNAGRAYEMLRNAMHLEPLVRAGRGSIEGAERGGKARRIPDAEKLSRLAEWEAAIASRRKQFPDEKSEARLFALGISKSQLSKYCSLRKKLTGK